MRKRIKFSFEIKLEAVRESIMVLVQHSWHVSINAAIYKLIGYLYLKILFLEKPN